MATSDSPKSIAASRTLQVIIRAILNSVVPAYYIPSLLKFISWDAPFVAHTGVDVDYKMTGYDWFNRTLIWSVTSGPAGMTIDADGTLHWTPTVEGTQAVTLTCSLGGQESVTKTFNVAVDNARCIFIATDGNDSTGTGAVGAPLATFEAASSLVSSATTSRVIYHRGGVYTKNPMNFYGTVASMRTLAEKSWPAGESLLIRNYPSEAVEYFLQSGGGWRFYGSGNVVYGMDVRGAGALGTNANGTEQGGVVISGKSVAKRMRVYDYDCTTNGNCTGFRHTANTILDQCQAWDNFDRLTPNFHNNSNFLAYATGAVSGSPYVIDCLSDGLTGGGVCGFKLKHAGENPPHYHKCVDTGTPEAFTAITKRMTIRHCVSMGGIDHGRTDATTGGLNNTNEGFLVQHCIIFAQNNLFSFAPWQEAVIFENPPAYLDNELISFSSAAANVFEYGQYTSSSGYANWNMLFSRNKIYTPSPANACRVKGIMSGLATLTDKGVDNEILTGPKNYTFSAAGRNFQVSSGVCTEVI
jgi:hypothetical protein